MALKIDKILKFQFLKNQAKQSQLALELFNRVISHCDLNNEQVTKLCIYLWNLSLFNQPNPKFQVIYINFCTKLIF